MIATETMTPVFDKAFYRPGESVNVQLQVARGVEVEATITHLSQTIATLMIPVSGGVAVLNWTPPAAAPRGYGLDLRVLDAGGQVVATLSAAFDVLERWLQAPRYGFLSQFEPGRDNMDEAMQWAARYHLNGLQFYDWQFRHESLLPPANTDIYADLLGKRMSYDVVKRLIAAAHAHNIAAMPYTAIYGASKGFYDDHPEWALFQASGELFRFGDDFLIIMNPAPGSPWTAHLMGEFARLLDETAFDGIHIDQYGAPKNGFDSAGQSVQLDEAFPAFINATAEIVRARRGDAGAVIFNAVGNWPVDTAAPANQDAVYIEVWQPYRNFMDLHRIVVRAQHLGGGKPVIIAAYIAPEREHNVRLANALIFASGGYYLEFGEPGALLADPYFPKFGVMDAGLQTVMARYQDFMVRYENVLALNTADASETRAAALTLDGVITQSPRSRDRVAVIVRQGADFETFNLVNLSGINTPHWDEPVTEAPMALTNTPVRINTIRPVARVWLASPDSDTLAMQPVNFTADVADAGPFIRFTLPRLDYWTMLLVEYNS